MTELAKSHSDTKRAARQADFIVFPITCLVLEVQLDIWSLIEQYCLNLSNLVGKVLSEGRLTLRILNKAYKEKVFRKHKASWYMIRQIKVYFLSFIIFF